jgi:hypothetical protein
VQVVGGSNPLAPTILQNQYVASTSSLQRRQAGIQRSISKTSFSDPLHAETRMDVDFAGGPRRSHDVRRSVPALYAGGRVRGNADRPWNKLAFNMLADVPKESKLPSRGDCVISFDPLRPLPSSRGVALDSVQLLNNRKPPHRVVGSVVRSQG